MHISTVSHKINPLINVRVTASDSPMRRDNNWVYAIDFGYDSTIYLSQEEADKLFSRLNLAMLAEEAESKPEIASAKEIEELSA